MTAIRLAETLEVATEAITQTVLLMVGLMVLYALYLWWHNLTDSARKRRRREAVARQHDQAAAAEALLCQNMLSWLDDEILKEKIHPRDGQGSSAWLRSLTDAQHEVTIRLLVLDRRDLGTAVSAERKGELKALWDYLRDAK